MNVRPSRIASSVILDGTSCGQEAYVSIALNPWHAEWAPIGRPFDMDEMVTLGGDVTFSRVILPLAGSHQRDRSSEEKSQSSECYLIGRDTGLRQRCRYAKVCIETTLGFSQRDRERSNRRQFEITLGGLGNRAQDELHLVCSGLER